MALQTTATNVESSIPLQSVSSQTDSIFIENDVAINLTNPTDTFVAIPEIIDFPIYAIPDASNVALGIVYGLEPNKTKTGTGIVGGSIIRSRTYR